MKFAPFPPSGQSPGAAQPGFQQQVEAWRQLVTQCGQKPSRKGVHSLRVATLRLQAGVEFWLRNQTPDAEAARAAKRWNKQGKKLRRALNPVREADVSLAMLAVLRATMAGPPEGHPHCSRSCVREISELERKLTERRQTAAKMLMAGIQDRRKRLERLSAEVVAAVAPTEEHAWGCSGRDISILVASLREEFPELNAKTLHPYRKRIKKLRYLAEISAAADPLAERQATTLKRVQSAAGKWHDWQSLAEGVDRTFRGGSGSEGLAKLLEARAQESLQEALGLVERATAQLLKRDVKGVSSSQLQQEQSRFIPKATRSSRRDHQGAATLENPRKGHGDSGFAL